ncbi:hypothetical protein I4I73_21250 [Pseudonocardia sp. KRD-184]|uniref:ATP synthase protein I n=1 Tax=Pseudonocardia oceani TaxID=2792013 RepID=A0ABS6U5X8_9PSEU|nr:hypothetical protein [Pseudonocardia oceani]MBW0088053.1 hypothetical protein [Pseudonocardia oceani]MBW0098518.1 hypothetical protein [Pseudonocardia oceani]MBW0108269.1 hypothetical protein [Pseudonocardia oceani]MBW0122470.1 hypothetical protein [Pseudonocardia oceani]MBW0127627.1 hypothetical protein [Pseudonocardia oceani]
MIRTLPEGQEQTLLALASSMRRGVLVATAVVGVPTVVVAGALVGPQGAVSAFAGIALALLAALFTLWLMHRTAGKEPKAVMMASLGGFVQKMIFLLIALFGLASVPGVHRMSLAVATIVGLLATTAAEGWAGYRLRTLLVVPEIMPATSGSPTGMSGSSAEAADGTGGGTSPGPVRPETSP